ncbi:putative T7SS-secreted protein [Streptomyces botrytidirepellens]|uniref:putative T7SS-secreted protein n=1 Tax=Streptomyces botrytidirepellens TaxID=2486417 RepID=UPI00319E0924
MNTAADYVRDKGDQAANALGADVDELQLDQTEDEKKLIRGNPDKLRGAANHLTDFMKAFEKVAGGGLKGLDSHHLKGRTADAFREGQEGVRRPSEEGRRLQHRRLVLQRPVRG